MAKQLTFSQIAALFLAVCSFAIHFPWRLCNSFFTRERNKTWKQICTSVIMTTLARYRKTLPMPESLTSYTAWTTATGLEANVEELCDGAKLLWVGPKRVDKVMLWCHGGGYMLSVGPNSFSWLRYIQLELKKRDIDLGIAIVAYNLLPKFVFPSQLREATDGFNHLIAAGVRPENIILGGDSTGGNLALQLLSHILYPLPSVQPTLKTVAHLGGLILLSPLVGAKRTLEMSSSQLEALHERDFLPAEFHREVCRTFLKDVPEGETAYADGLEAPEEWFKPSDELVGRILIMAGEWDFLKESSRRFYENRLKPLHRDVKFVVEKDGEHIAPILDFILKEEKLSVLTPLMVEWLADTFQAARRQV
ncbi:Alpha/Beta hydrolase protein [Desarmillaria tabescens]|uniref:Alpha/Beta hydrolase protein n=1 Tax=Armillaria tabescens TaxID=1929756 RepID=A0AA39MMK2_ARMTA|nr:Alpha/Beta hydrolase protein [Desarmillaria tabescens]KAK0439249.1 Alpha/Beta hydrolase protein [Desarmillaria tabescens]